MSERQLLELVRDELRALPAYAVPRPEAVEVKLDANEHPFPLPPDAAADLARELAQVELNRYPDPGCGELRRILAAEHQVDPDAIVFGNGSDEIIHLLCAVFSRARPGRSRAAALYPVPTFSIFRIAAAGCGLDAVEVPLLPDFRLDRAALERALEASRPNLAFFARPNNPTGTLWPIAEIAALARAHTDVLFISDEAYADYGGESALPLLPELENLVVMRTLSKIGLAALRVGYLVGRPDLCREVEKVRGPYNIGALNQRAAAWLLVRHRERFRDRCREVVRQRARVAAALSALPGVHVFPSEANLLLFRVGDPGDGRATRLWRELLARGILVRSFDAPGPLSGCLRVTIGTAAENDRLLAALAELIP